MSTAGLNSFLCSLDKLDNKRKKSEVVKKGLSFKQRV